MVTTDFTIRGMDCAEEVAALRSELARLPGIKDLSFDILNRRMSVSHSDADVSVAYIVAAVARTGMSAELWTDAASGNLPDVGWSRWGPTAFTVASGLLLAAGLLSHLAIGGIAALGDTHTDHAVPWSIRMLYGLSVVVGAWFVVPKGLRALRRLRPDMNLLMTVAVVGAVAIGEYFEAATVAFLFSVSLALESWSVGRARRAIAALMALSPDTARVITEAGESIIPARDVVIGTTVVVHPGERFPLDGRITKGETTVNQAPITGESAPVSKTVGSEIFAGTINDVGAVEFVTTKRPDDTTLAKIIRMVGDAQRKRSHSEQWVEQFARYYTPVVMALAIFVMIFPPLVFQGTWTHWLYNGLVLLVIACPCALVISTPVSITAALTSAARQGVLVKGGQYMEEPARLKLIAVDKTGTITEGRPEVHKVIPLANHSEIDVLTIAAAIEARSEHPLAKAVLRAAASQGISVSPAENFLAIKGKGATAVVGGRATWIGSHRLVEERGQESLDLHESLLALAKDGASTFVVGDADQVFGIIAVMDRVRPEAKRALQEMRNAGIERIIMLSGDNRAAADAVGQFVGVDEVRAELLPEDKVVAIEELVTTHGHVAMIGDGVNDAPAMARANLGIAMGAVGTDAALETADIALMGDDLTAVAWLIRHAHRTLRTIRQNIFSSLGVKAIFVALTFAGYASLWSAIAADMGASLLVIFNGLRLLRDKAKLSN